MAPALDPERLGDHLDRLYRAAWALSGSREDAEDLVQETYARVLSRPRLLRNEDDLGYLLPAPRNTFPNERRTTTPRLRPTASSRSPAPGAAGSVPSRSPTSSISSRIPARYSPRPCSRRGSSTP